jgi:peptidoglycan/LPS O-acetylase OafA/YrhL
MGLLRYFLAIVVVIGHSPMTLFNKPLNADGGLAVQSFYAISGFYMALIIHKYHLQTHQWVHLKNFYISRALRIYPIYWICFGAVFCLATLQWIPEPLWPTAALNSLQNLQDKVFYLFQSIFIFGLALMRFVIYDPHAQAFFLTFTGTNNAVVEQQLAQVGSQYVVLGQAWTLSLELTFYLLVPLVLTRSRRFIVTLCVASLTLKFLLYYLGYSYKNYNLQVAFFPAELGIFLLGALSQIVIYPWLKTKSILFLQRSTRAFFAFLILYTFVLFPRIGSYDLKSALFIGLVIFSLPFLFCYYSHSKLDRWLGDLSYPVYMTHYICLGLIEHFKLCDSLYVGYYAVLLSTLISIGLIRMVIMPLDRFRYAALNGNQNASLSLSAPQDLTPVSVQQV